MNRKSMEKEGDNKKKWWGGGNLGRFFLLQLGADKGKHNHPLPPLPPAHLDFKVCSKLGVSEQRLKIKPGSSVSAEKKTKPKES